MIKFEAAPDYEFWYNEKNSPYGCIEYRSTKEGNVLSQASFYLIRKFEKKEIDGLLSSLNHALRVGYYNALKDVKTVVRER